MSRATLRLLGVSLTAFSMSLGVLSGQGGGGGGRGGPAGGGQAGPRGGGPGGGAGGRGAVPPRDATSQTAVGTAVIAGTVFTEGTGSPVRRARVSLSATELRGARSVITDEQGRFTFGALPAGRYTMTASKSGYVDNTYGAKRAGRPGTQIQLADGQKLDRANINLPRGGVITGIVIDDFGEPSPGTQVRALRYVMRTGERTLTQAGQDTTDDRGMYRIYQLQPGDYIVNAVPRNMTAGDVRQVVASEIAAVSQQLQAGAGRAGGAGGIDISALANMAAGRGEALGARLAELQQQLSTMEQGQPTAYAPVYFPGTTVAASASTITLGVSEERAGVDFRLQLVPTSRVGGLVVSNSGTLPTGTQVGLIPADRGSLPNIPGVGNTVTRVGGEGRFTFNSVTPGQYTVQARATIREPAPTGRATGAAEPANTFPGRPGGPGQGAISQVLWASALIEVGSTNPPDTVLTLQPGMSVSGRVAFDSSTTAGTAAVDLTRVRVTLSPRGQQMFEIGGGPAPVQADASGRFSIVGVAPGRYGITATIAGGGAGGGAGRATGPGFGGVAAGGRGTGEGPVGAPTTQTGGQWQLESAIADGRDLLDFPIDIGPNQNISNLSLTFTQESQELSGTIQDVSGRPTSDFTIIVFTPDNRYWLPQARRIASTRPGTDGRFTFRNLPAGDYRLTAVTDVEPGEWYDPAFLTQLSAVSIPVNVGPGEKKVQDIRLAGGQ